MGSHPSAMLVFGIAIGSADDTGTLGPLGEYDELAVDWLPEGWDELETEDGEPVEYAGLLIDTLATRSGAPGDLDSYDREKWVERHLGVEVISWGHYEYPRWMLAPTGKQYRIDGGSNYEPCVVVPADLAPHDLATGTAKLMHALSVLGLTTTRQPCWLLVPSYG